MLAWIAVAASAQTVSVGFHAGATFSKAIYDDEDLDELSDRVVGYLVGLPVEVGLSPNFAFQAELNFLQRGQRTTFGIGPVVIPDLETVTRVTYLDGTVLAKFGEISRELTVAGVVGPSLSYGLTRKDTREDVTETIDWADEGLQRTDFGLVFGAQGGLGLGRGEVTMDLRYRLGMSDLFEGEGGEDVQLNTRSFMVGLGYLLPILP